MVNKRAPQIVSVNVFCPQVGDWNFNCTSESEISFFYPTNLFVPSGKKLGGLHEKRSAAKSLVLDEHKNRLCNITFSTLCWLAAQ